MKAKLIFTMIMIVFIISLTAVNAEDNQTIEVLNVSDNPQNMECDVSDINVTFPEQMWEENLSDINVGLPEDASGDFTLRIDDEIIYNQTITDKTFKIPFKLPKNTQRLVIAVYPPIDYEVHRISAFYNNVNLNITDHFKIMKYSPEYNNINFPEEILQYDKYSPMIVFPRSANGCVEFYIDNKLYMNTTARATFYFNDNPFSKLSLGKHSFRINYHGDAYYRAFNRTFDFTVTDVIINIPDVVDIGHNDCIHVKTLDKKGNVKLYIDGKLLHTSQTYDGEAIISLEEYVKYTDSEVKVVYTGDKTSRTKIKPLNMTYNFDVWLARFIYGQDNILEISLPDTFNNKLLKTTIDGKNYQFKRSELENNVIELDISKFKAGNYTLFISFPGDSKYYPLNRTCNFIIEYDIDIPYYFTYSSEAEVSLKLPEDAKGELMVYSDGKYFKSSKFTKGYASVKISSLNLGYHDILAVYSGDDYNVSNQSGRVYIAPLIDFDDAFTAGEDKYITVKVPASSKGYVIFELNGKKHRVNVKNGAARFSLKKLNVGYYEFEISYYGENGFKDTYNWAEFTVKKPKTKILTMQATFKGVNVKIKLTNTKGKALSGKYVTVKFNGKKYKLKTDKKGFLKFKKSMKLKKTHYTLKITYMGFKLTKKLKVKPVHIRVSKSKKKLTVKVTVNKKIRNQKITVKINSKKYIIKTNKKGIAKLSVKKPVKVKSVKATYLKNTVSV